MRNLLLMTDVYKMHHAEMYPDGTTEIYSYLTTRSNKKYNKVLFYGLQPILKMLQAGVSKEDVKEFLDIREMILGPDTRGVITKGMNALAELGYIPLEIKAVPEGTYLDNKNVLMTMRNTHPDFPWVVGFFESMILKLWNTCTVATSSKKFKTLVEKYADETCGNRGLVPFQVHDFGYRGVSSEETAELSGSAHLVSFYGTDTVSAVSYVKKNYGVKAGNPIGLSVPASEHSVMCSFGREGELDAFKNMLKLYPTGLVSIVSDTYDLWNVLTNFASTLKEEILARDGKVVFRPDSGDPEKILLGNALTYNEYVKVMYSNMDTLIYEKDGKFFESSESYDQRGGSRSTREIKPTPENKGCIRLLDEMFGSTVNELGYKELNPKVGLIYGDGMYFERFERILTKMKEMGYASNNLVIGVGGLLLQQHNRDDLGFAIKATYAIVNGQPRNLLKDPITDSGKKSHTGLMMLTKENGVYVTKDNCTEEEEKTGLLTSVFKDGKILRTQTFDEIRDLAGF